MREQLKRLNPPSCLAWDRGFNDFDVLEEPQKTLFAKMLFNIKAILLSLVALPQGRPCKNWYRDWHFQ